MIELRAGEVVGIFGPVSSGKSFQLDAWAKTMKASLVYDIPGDHYELDGIHVTARPKLGVETIRDAKVPYRVIYHPVDPEVSFAVVAGALWLRDEPRWLVIDEIHELMSPHYENDFMRVLNKYARKRAVLGVIGASQRIADVHKNFTSACRMVVLFHTHESRDIDAISERWGEEVAGNVENLASLVYREDSQKVERFPEVVVIRRDSEPRIVSLAPDGLRQVRRENRGEESIRSDNEDEESSGNETQE